MKMIVDTKFQLQLIIMIFWTKFAEKGCFRSKTEKVNTTIEFCMLKLVYAPNFTLNLQFWFFGPSLQKNPEDFQSKMEKFIIPIEFCIFESV